MLSRWLLQQWNVPGVAAISQRWPRCHPFGSSPEQIVVVDCNFGAGSHHCARHRHHCAYAPNASQTSTFAANEARSRIILCGRWAATGHQCRWQHAESKFFFESKIVGSLWLTFYLFSLRNTCNTRWHLDRAAVCHCSYSARWRNKWRWSMRLAKDATAKCIWAIGMATKWPSKFSTAATKSHGNERPKFTARSCCVTKISSATLAPIWHRTIPAPNCGCWPTTIHSDPSMITCNAKP